MYVKVSPPAPPRGAKKQKPAQACSCHFPPSSAIFWDVSNIWPSVTHQIYVLCICIISSMLVWGFNVETMLLVFSRKFECWLITHMLCYFFGHFLCFLHIWPQSPSPPPNPILRRDKCVGEKCTWIYSAQPGTGTERRYLTLSTIISLLIQYSQSIQSKSLQ